MQLLVLVLFIVLAVGAMVCVTSIRRRATEQSDARLAGSKANQSQTVSSSSSSISAAAAATVTTATATNATAAPVTTTDTATQTTVSITSKTSSSVGSIYESALPAGGDVAFTPPPAIVPKSDQAKPVDSKTPETVAAVPRLVRVPKPRGPLGRAYRTILRTVDKVRDQAVRTYKRVPADERSLEERVLLLCWMPTLASVDTANELLAHCYRVRAWHLSSYLTVSLAPSTRDQLKVTPSRSSGDSDNGNDELGVVGEGPGAIDRLFVELMVSSKLAEQETVTNARFRRFVDRCTVEFGDRIVASRCELAAQHYLRYWQLQQAIDAKPTLRNLGHRQQQQHASKQAEKSQTSSVDPDDTITADKVTQLLLQSRDLAVATVAALLNEAPSWRPFSPQTPATVTISEPAFDASDAVDPAYYRPYYLLALQLLFDLASREPELVHGADGTATAFADLLDRATRHIVARDLIDLATLPSYVVRGDVPANVMPTLTQLDLRPVQYRASLQYPRPLSVLPTAELRLMHRHWSRQWTMNRVLSVLPTAATDSSSLLSNLGGRLYLGSGQDSLVHRLRLVRGHVLADPGVHKLTLPDDADDTAGGRHDNDEPVMDSLARDKTASLRRVYLFDFEHERRAHEFATEQTVVTIRARGLVSLDNETGRHVTSLLVDFPMVPIRPMSPRDHFVWFAHLIATFATRLANNSDNKPTVTVVAFDELDRVLSEPDWRTKLTVARRFVDLARQTYTATVAEMKRQIVSFAATQRFSRRRAIATAVAGGKTTVTTKIDDGDETCWYGGRRSDYDEPIDFTDFGALVAAADSFGDRCCPVSQAEHHLWALLADSWSPLRQRLVEHLHAIQPTDTLINRLTAMIMLTPAVLRHHDFLDVGGGDTLSQLVAQLELAQQAVRVPTHLIASPCVLSSRDKPLSITTIVYERAAPTLAQHQPLRITLHPSTTYTPAGTSKIASWALQSDLLREQPPRLLLPIRAHPSTLLHAASRHTVDDREQRGFEYPHDSALTANELRRNAAVSVHLWHHPTATRTTADSVEYDLDEPFADISTLVNPIAVRIPYDPAIRVNVLNVIWQSRQYVLVRQTVNTITFSRGVYQHPSRLPSCRLWWSVAGGDESRALGIAHGVALDSDAKHHVRPSRTFMGTSDPVTEAPPAKHIAVALNETLHGGLSINDNDAVFYNANALEYERFDVAVPGPHYADLDRH